MTNGWVDIKNADVILAMGGNPAENHPCGFKWAVEAQKTRNAQLVVVDPALHADCRGGRPLCAAAAGNGHRLSQRHHPLRPRQASGTTRSTSSSTPTLRTSSGRSTGSTTGLFSGFDETKGSYDKSAWAYEADPKTRRLRRRPDASASALRLPAAEEARRPLHPGDGRADQRARPRTRFLKVAEVVTSTCNAERVGTITYALGWTQHSVGVQMIRTAAMLQLLLGNVGRPGGGVNALRGHSNIQGATDIGGTFEILSGYLATPRSELADLEDVPREGARPRRSTTNPGRR